MRRTGWSCVVAVVLWAASPSWAAEIVGRIESVGDQQIGIRITGELEPQPGDKFRVTIDVPGVGTAQVAVGQVKQLENGVVIGVVTQATGSVAIGQTATIDSPQAVRKPPPAPSAGGDATAADGIVERLGLTVRSVDQATAELLDLPSAKGAVVAAVKPGSAAEAAGVKKRDVIVKVGQAVAADAADVGRRLAAATGESAALEVWRDGTAHTLTLKLPPVSAAPTGSAAAATPAAPAVWIGLQVENLREGVGVVSSIPGSPGARAGFRPGDHITKLDGAAVTEIAPFVKDVSTTPAGVGRKIELVRDGETVTVELTPESKPTNEQLFERMKTLAETGDHDAEYQLALMYESGWGTVARDQAEAVKWLKKSADAGVARAQSEYGAALINGDGIAKDVAAGVEWTRKAAEQGHPTAVSNMGTIYRDGLGVEKNPDEARRWFEKTLALGTLKGLLEVAAQYENGTVFEKDPARAAELYRVAAQRGSYRGQYHWGRCLSKGIGVAADRIAAAAWLKKASDGGDAWADVELGDLYADGRGVVQDLEQAVRLYRKAAAVEDPTGMLRLGYAYYDGKGVAQDRPEAAKWFRAAADKNDLTAQFQIGLMHDLGLGVAQNDAEAVKWYRRAADRGYSVAQYNLSLMYNEGRGVEKNLEQALAWCHKAAQQDYAQAENRMGEISFHGLGCGKDATVAYGWFKSAAEKGVKEAQFNLAALYSTGSGVEKNMDECIRWLRRSAAQGYQPAIDELKKRTE